MAGQPGRSGGTRPGAGRKPKKEKYAGKIAKAERRIADRLVELVDRAFELAQGVPIVEGLPLGAELKRLGEIVDQMSSDIGDTAELAEITAQLEAATTNLKHTYRTAPNFKAIEYLVNRIMGKPTERKELTGEDGGAIITKDISVLTPDERARRIDELIAQRGD